MLCSISSGSSILFWATKCGFLAETKLVSIYLAFQTKEKSTISYFSIHFNYLSGQKALQTKF
jgi:hypothetical protein